MDPGFPNDASISSDLAGVPTQSLLSVQKNAVPGIKCHATARHLY